jgi:hypothetical protein
MSDEDDDTLTGADVFGEPVPGEAVTPKDVDRYRNDRPRQRFVYRSDGKPIHKRTPDDLEKELPDDYCPDGTARACRHVGRARVDQDHGRGRRD